MTEKHYDAIIIGFGKGGKTLAGRLAAAGKRVAMIEQSSAMYGGTCINVGCIPSKTLIHSAAKSAEQTGMDFAGKVALYRQAVEEKRRLTAMLRGENYDKLADHPNIDVIDGVGSFLNPTTVKVERGEETIQLTADNIFINTGATSVIPGIPGIEGNEHVYYSDTLMDRDALPEQLVIIGGGYIGLEFASMYANFGSKVTVLQDSPAFVPREDDDIGAAMKELLEAQGVHFCLGAAIESVGSDGTVTFRWNDTALEKKADAILVATGRRPNTDLLNLPAVNVKTDARGGIITDSHRETSQKGIYAMGDVVGGLQFTYVSLDDYRVVASALEGGTYTAEQRKNVSYSVFLATPLSRVGLNEKEAKAAGVPYRVVKMPTAAIPKAQVLGKPQGMLKALIAPETGKILGVMLLCEESYEMINIVKLAMDFGADYTVLRDQIFTHPTMSEALNDLFGMK